jgi:hypothetical protein
MKFIVLLVLLPLVCAEEKPAILESDAVVLRELLQVRRPARIFSVQNLR